MIKRYIKVIICSILALLILVLNGCSAMAQKQLEEQQQETVTEDVLADNDVQPEIETQPETEAETEQETEEEPVMLNKTSTVYTLTFAGDCTLGGIYEHRFSPGSFDDYLGDNYEYPFEHCQPYFAHDDFTLVNLEGVLSNSHAAVTKRWRLIGEPEYAKILTVGNIDAVNLANNHTYDFGTGGYADTKAALESEAMPYVEEGGTLLFTTDSGLVIGVYADQFNANETRMIESIKKLREDGAEIIIFSYHGGIELSYRSSYTQEYYFHKAIDAGADIVFGHHPHVLQPVEEYNGGIIYYSLGNFSFGGNGNPQDKDSAIIQQKIVRDKDGNVSLGETVLIPFSVTSTPGTNDYKPIPLEEGTDQYNRCMEKLTGTYTGPDLQPAYSDEEEEEETKEEENENTQPSEEDTGAETPPEEGGEEDGGVTVPPEGESGDTPPAEEGGEENLPEEGGGETPPSDDGGEAPEAPSEETPPSENENTEG